MINSITAMHPFYFRSFEIWFHLCSVRLLKGRMPFKITENTYRCISERRKTSFLFLSQLRPFIPSLPCKCFDIKISTRKMLAIIQFIPKASSSLGFCTFCFCFPTKMLHLDASFFPAVSMLDRFRVIKVLLIPNILRRFKVNKNV